MKWHKEMEKIWDNMISEQKESWKDQEMAINRTDLASDEIKVCSECSCPGTPNKPLKLK